MLRSVAFRFSFVRSLLLNQVPYGGNLPDEMFPLIYKQVIWELAPQLAVVLRVRGGGFPEYWKFADVVPLPEESSFSDVGDYRPISITPVLSKIFEEIVARKLSYFLKSNSPLLPSQFSYPRGIGTYGALLTLSRH